MFKVITMALIAGAIAATSMTPASAAAGKGFTLHNSNDDVAIEQVWFAHNGESNDPWREMDMSRPVGPNQSSDFTITGGSSCFYDIKVAFSDGAVQTFSNINICKWDRLRAI